ncbi:hypothetical protein MYX82_02100 [Acidobacteria bacterium AH-259-D05]|nr:hypothetical protein [Acidobacteria bacterium AH-259-D05]
MKDLFEQNIGNVAVLNVPHSEPLKGTVAVPYGDYVLLKVGEMDHFVAYQHIISVFFHSGTPLTVTPGFEEEHASFA